MDKWGLNVIHSGYLIEFASLAPPKCPSPYPFRGRSHKSILKQVFNLQQRGAIEHGSLHTKFYHDTPPILTGSHRNTKKSVLTATQSLDFIGATLNFYHCKSISIPDQGQITDHQITSNP